MSKSKIEWTDETDNVIVVEGEDGRGHGWYCEKVSEGCQHCYAERLNGTPFYGGNGLAYAKRKEGPPKLMLRRDILEGWGRKRVGKRRFVNSMTDTFGEFVPNEWIDEMFAWMALAPLQTFQVLTKRAGRMFDYLTNVCDHEPMVYRVEAELERICGERGWCSPDMKWPLPNVWLGVSVENQDRADERVPYLLRTPAAVRFLSVEPLLGSVDISILKNSMGHLFSLNYSGIKWVIVGGESGPNARPMHPAWVRSVRDQCQAAGVAFFFKQWGEWLPTTAEPVRGKYTGGGIFLRVNGHYGNQGDWWNGQAEALDRVGKKKAGRVLDGREWNQFPVGFDTPIKTIGYSTNY